jgi:acyl-CoA thioesterase-1
MDRHRFRRPRALAYAVAAVLGFVATPLAAQMQAATPIAKDAPLAAAAESHAVCRINAGQDRLEYPLVRVSRHLEEERPIKIVTIGSSSTAGAGASSTATNYPSQLEADLTQHFLWNDVTVLNRGVNGEEAPDMLARFDKDVIDEHPDLVIWQTGTNAVLRDRPLDPKATVLHQGLARLKAIHADVILLDPQYAPKVIAKADADAMVAQIAATAKEQSVDVFRRFAMMKRWYQVDHMPFDAFVSPDGLHMNDWSYGCLAKWLATAIQEAATRPTTVAHRAR